MKNAASMNNMSKKQSRPRLLKTWRHTVDCPNQKEAASSSPTDSKSGPKSLRNYVPHIGTDHPRMIIIIHDNNFEAMPLLHDTIVIVNSFLSGTNLIPWKRSKNSR